VEIGNLIPRDPFKPKKSELKSKKELGYSVEQLAPSRKSIADISITSHHSIEQIRNILNPSSAVPQKLTVIRRHEKKSFSHSNSSGSKSNLKSNPSIKNASLSLIPPTFKLSAIVPINDDSLDVTGFTKEDDMLIPMDMASDFRALPFMITRYCPSVYIAFLGLVIMLISIGQVVISMAS
jgi:hypothetical protein